MVEKSILVPIADGSEEIETTCITDTLKRCGGNVVVASVMPSDTNLICTMSRGIKIVADIDIKEALNKEWDVIILPGGMPGAKHLRDSEALQSLLLKQKQEKKYYGAICASPAIALSSKNDLITNKKVTCYPAEAFTKLLSEDYYVDDKDVVIDDNVITSKGPGTAIRFALMIGEILFGKEVADIVANAMLVER